MQPSDASPNIFRMFHAVLVCSDEGCAEELEATGSLEELGALACECGCALQVIAVSEVAFVETTWEWHYPLAAAA